MLLSILIFVVVCAFSYQSQIINIQTTPNLIKFHPNLRTTRFVEIPFQLNDLNSPLIDVCVGEPQQCFVMKIATNMCESFIISPRGNRKGYEISKSTTAQSVVEPKQISYSTEKLTAYKVQDNLSIKNAKISLINFSFYLVIKGFDNSLYDGVIGLGHIYSDNSFSLIQMLYNQYYLGKLMFSTTFISRESRGILRIGYHSLSKSEKYKVTNLIWEQEKKFFEIQINSIIVSKGPECYTYNKLQDTLVSPGSNRMFCPKEFFYFMKNTIFQNFDGDICTTERDGPYQYIRCWRKLIRKIDFGIIKFIIGKWNLELNLNDLFAECEGYLCFEIAYFEQNTRWVFGYPLLKEYHTIFDKENMKIYFKKLY